MPHGSLRALRLRPDASHQGFVVFLAVAATFVALLLSARQGGLAAFSLAIMLGATGIAYAVADFLIHRRPRVVADADGLYAEAIGRTLPWQALHGAEVKGDVLTAGVEEGPLTWTLRLDLGGLRVSARQSADLERWLAKAEAAGVPLPAGSAEAGDYLVAPVPVGRWLPGTSLAFVLAMLTWMAWKIPPLAVAFAPFGLVMGGMLAAMRSVWRPMALRANRHSLWVNARRSLPWSAIREMRLTEIAGLAKRRLVIELGEAGRGEVIEIDTGSLAALPEDILAGLNRFFRPAGRETDGPGQGYVPNAIPLKTRLLHGAIVVLLVAWGGLGVLVDDLIVPAKRHALHLHGVPAWIMYAAWLLGAAYYASVIVDHYDRRNNEAWYKRFQTSVSTTGWVLFVAALLVSFLPGMNDMDERYCERKVIRSVPSPDGRRVAYASIMVCRDEPVKAVSVSVLPAGQPLTDNRGNTAHIGWPHKFVDLRWRDGGLQVVHGMPWKLRPENNPPVPVSCVTQ